MLQALARFGAPRKIEDRLSAEEEDFPVWSENWETVQVFQRLGSQWDRLAVVGLGAAKVLVTGLRYDRVESALRMMAVPRKRWPEIFEGLQVMERVALKVMNE